MAEYTLVDSPAWDTVSASQNGDGTSTFWTNSFLPMFGRLSALAEYLDYNGDKLGTTLTGTEIEMGASISFVTPGTSVVHYPPGQLSDTSQSLILNNDIYLVPVLTAARTYTVNDPTRAGQVISISKHNNSAYNAVIKRADASTIVTFDVSGSSFFGYCELVSRETSPDVFAWSLKTWGGNAVPANDPL